MINLKLPYFLAKMESNKITKKEDVENNNNNEILKNIGKNVRTLRKLNKLTIKDLAEKSGLSAIYIFSIEKNNQNISVTHLKDIAEALGVKMHILLLDNTDIYRILEIHNKLKKYSYKELIYIEKSIEEKIVDTIKAGHL